MRWIGVGQISGREKLCVDDPTARPGPRVLVLTRYGRLSPTTRIRFLQFIDRLEQDFDGELSFDVAPLLEDHALERFYADGSRSLLYLLRRYIKRAALLARSGRYDMLWIEKELFPAMPAIAERVLSAFNVKMIVDYDDAAFAWYRRNPNSVIRHLLGGKIDAVCRSAEMVVAGNETLASFARGAGAGNVVVLPSVVPMRALSQRRSDIGSRDSFVVGWIGTPSNVRYLELFRDALIEMSSDPQFKMITIGAPGQLFSGVRQEAHAWSEQTESELLSRCDCTVAPLANGVAENGKCGYKVIQAMAAGLPVIASPVGVIRQIVRHGENGFLAETDAQCLAVLKDLQREPALRLRIGRAARQTVQRRFSTDVTTGRLLGVFDEVLGGKRLNDGKRAPTTAASSV